MDGDERMSGEEGAPKKPKAQPSRSEKEKISAENAIRIYIGAYIDSYMDHVEELNIKESDFPLFYTNYPFDVTCYILPDNSICVLFRGLASAMKIEVIKEDYNTVDAEISEKRFHHICCYPPSHSYTPEEARREAKSDVKQDIENAQMLVRDDVDAISKAETLRSIRILNVVTPWISKRQVGKGTLKVPPPNEASKFESDNLKIRESEDFINYSERLRNLVIPLLGAPPPKPESDVEVKTTTTPAPIPPPGQPATNINIEIKQPETPQKEEAFDDKMDMDILRLKKTLYLQTTDIEELRRSIRDITNKLTNYEQMRQTVFRMNRRVFDADTRIGNVEKSNRDSMKKVAEMKAEQREENKKTRRFIEEKSKKARNQAMILGVVAIAISMVTLLFGLPLIIEYWEVVSNFFGF
jgi:hypothetical protein